MRKHGSLTIWFSLTFTVTLIVLFSLLEAGRFAGAKATAKAEDELAVMSVFAQYNRELLEEYGIFAMDISYGSGTNQKDRLTTNLLNDLQKERVSSGWYLGSEPQTVELIGYRLLTDLSNQDYISQACAYETLNLAEDVLEAGKSYLENTTVEESELSMDDLFDSADQAKQKAKQERAEQERTAAEDEEAELPQALESNVSSQEADGIFSTLKRLTSQGILSFVLPSGTVISGSSIATPFSTRTREVGTSGSEEDPAALSVSAVTQKALFTMYLINEFGSFASPKEGTALCYEKEYILVGKKTDQENLHGVINRILLAREAVNFLYLQRDTAKKTQANAVATAIAGISGNPILVEIVEQAILASWAYVESMTEVKALMSGERLPLVKTAADWRTDLFALASSMSETETSSTGLSYEDYLASFLYLEKITRAADRSLDLIEQNMRTKENQEKFQIDFCMSRIDVSIEREISTMFVGFTGQNKGQAFTDRIKYQYE